MPGGSGETPAEVPPRPLEVGLSSPADDRAAEANEEKYGGEKLPCVNEPQAAERDAASREAWAVVGGGRKRARERPWSAPPAVRLANAFGALAAPEAAPSGEGQGSGEHSLAEVEANRLRHLEAKAKAESAAEAKAADVAA